MCVLRAVLHENLYFEVYIKNLRSGFRKLRRSRVTMYNQRLHLNHVVQTIPSIKTHSIKVQIIFTEGVAKKHISYSP